MTAPDVRPAPRKDAAPVPLGLYAVYALILFAVPTFGASALLGLLAVTGREAPADPLAASHFTYQQRSLWAAAVAAAAGAILIVVGMGVFVLFLTAIWLLVRGAAGVLKLKAGRAIADPRGWWI
ncbi:MAG: serine/threonine protein kinase [Brevundimonas sp.]|nr:MAG: serine/threonine protein kinase [Brevundimonas sp.]